MVKPSSMGAIYTDNSANRRSQRIDNTVKQLADDMNTVKSGHVELKAVNADLNTHIATSDNNFSIDNVVTINDAYNRTEITFGLGFKVAPGAVFKADYQIKSNASSDEEKGQFNLGVGIWF